MTNELVDSQGDDSAGLHRRRAYYVKTTAKRLVVVNLTYKVEASSPEEAAKLFGKSDPVDEAWEDWGDVFDEEVWRVVPDLDDE